MDKKNGFHSSDFQKEFYDRLGRTKADNGGILSCSFEERYNPRMLVDDRHLTFLQICFLLSLQKGLIVLFRICVPARERTCQYLISFREP